MSDQKLDFLVTSKEKLSEEHFVSIVMAVQDENEKYRFEKACHELTKIINESNMPLELIKTGVKLFDELWMFHLNREDVEFKICVGALK